jgi:hypothetical protein
LEDLVAVGVEGEDTVAFGRSLLDPGEAETGDAEEEEGLELGAGDDDRGDLLGVGGGGRRRGIGERRRLG